MRYIAPFKEHDHGYFSRQDLHLQNHLYLSKRSCSTSHLHEIPNETECSNRSRLHIIMPTPVRHDHSNVHLKMLKRLLHRMNQRMQVESETRGENE
ncbi:hypothetical protein CEXT_354551 [Caerostris extrusa]|uniref:Uncharacterized protein n=1 Tax=Caerostris extrusa TaxID=172846 RepID=A0AAV4R9Q5_CAEEX|nr:hypothetical protein CEXT_354551 [Caerostris extrusa]